jgi:hypothetical protein
VASGDEPGAAVRWRELFNPRYVDALLADPERAITPKGHSKLWQLGLLECWLQTHGICRRHALPLRLVLARSEWAQRQDRAQPLIGVSSLRIYLDLRAALEGLAARDKPAAAQVFAVG